MAVPRPGGGAVRPSGRKKMKSSSKDRRQMSKNRPKKDPDSFFDFVLKKKIVSSRKNVKTKKKSVEEELFLNSEPFFDCVDFFLVGVAAVTRSS